VDATGGPREAVVAALAGPLLASRGVLVLTVASGPLDQARERLAAVPGAHDEPLLLAALDPLGERPGLPSGVVLPPGVGTRGEAEGGAGQRATAWDELLGRLGAVSRQAARPG
jgi:hypothetical protein